jgi:acyl carrier protein
MSIRSTILSLIEEIAADSSKKVPPLHDDLPLMESGLDSFGFAIMVAKLEDQLGVDPFTSTEDVHFPVTVGDFIGLYENAAR